MTVVKRPIGPLDWFESLPGPLVLAAALFLMVGVAWGDFITGPDISFRLFYLLPVFLVTWRLGRLPGMLIATLNAVDWILIREESFNTSGHPALPVWNMTIEIGFFFVVVLLIDTIRRGWRNAERIAQVDHLTGAANRRHFRARLDAVVADCRNNRHAFSLVYMDLDNFKAVNDSYGHTAGDHVLRCTVAEIQAELRLQDMVARLGGDEFAVLLPNTDFDGTRPVVERIHARLRAVFSHSAWPVSVSIGAVAFEAIPGSSDHIIHLVDSLMYTVKMGGKDGLKVERWPRPFESASARAFSRPLMPGERRSETGRFPAQSNQ